MIRQTGEQNKKRNLKMLDMKQEESMLVDRRIWPIMRTINLTTCLTMSVRLRLTLCTPAVRKTIHVGNDPTACFVCLGGQPE